MGKVTKYGMPDDVYYFCDNCKVVDGRPTVRWIEKAFVLCYQCIEDLATTYLPSFDPLVSVNRLTISEKMRAAILERFGHKCQSCGSEENLQIDHIIPFSRGGKTEQENLTVLRRPCNLRKRDKVQVGRG